MTTPPNRHPARLDHEADASTKPTSLEGLRIRFDGEMWRLENKFGLLQECTTEAQAETLRLQWLTVFGDKQDPPAR